MADMRPPADPGLRNVSASPMHKAASADLLAIYPEGERPNPLQRMAFGIQRFDG